MEDKQKGRIGKKRPRTDNMATNAYFKVIAFVLLSQKLNYSLTILVCL